MAFFSPPPPRPPHQKIKALIIKYILGISPWEHLSMKEGSLFCGYEICWTGMLEIMFLVSLESSWWGGGGVHGLGSMAFGLVEQKFLNIEWFLHWKNIYLWRKVVCFVVMRSAELGMLEIMFLVSLESSWWGGGVHGLGSMVFGLAVQKFLNIEWFFHWKLN